MSRLNHIHPNEPCPIMKLSGKSKPVLDFISLLAITEPMETDPDWWAVRLYCLFELQDWRN